jgi:hypothetical protein
MNRIEKILQGTALVFLILVLTGCGSFKKDHNETLAQDESAYQKGVSVGAVGLQEAQQIDLYVQEDNSGKWSKVRNGQYFAPGRYKLGVTVNPYDYSQKVNISDGGKDDGNDDRECWNEMLYDEKIKMYVAKGGYDIYPDDYFLITPILVQAIYPDGLASKAKFIVNNREGLRAPDGVLVDRGMSVSLSRDFLRKLPKAIEPLIAELLPGLKIHSIAPADNGPGRQSDGLLRIDVAGIACDLVLNDTYGSKSKPTRGLSIGIEDVTGGTSTTALELITNIFTSLFLRRLNIDNIPIMPIALNLGDTIKEMMKDPETMMQMLSTLGMDLPLEGLEIGLNMDSVLYVNIKGYPSETTAEYAILGGALYDTLTANAPKDPKDTTGKKYIWPDVTVDSFDTGIFPGMDTIKDGPTDLGIALSQYNLNQMIWQLMQGMQVELKAISKQFSIFAPKHEGDVIDLVMIFNPEGIAIDLATGRIVANDITMLVNERIPTSNATATMAVLSVDLSLQIDAGFRKDGKGQVVLDLSIAPIADLCHMHVLKDDLGMTIFDHGQFIPLIFKYLSKGSTTLALSLPLANLGLALEDSPGNKIVFDKQGNCFLGMAIDSLDMSKLPVSGGGCFINTLGF